MKSLIVVGLQWGDEGKGKIIDALAGAFHYVVRWNGGNNAGHTVVVNGAKFPLSLIPSGVIARKKLCIAQGAVVNPEVLLKEIDFLARAGYPVDLVIDSRVHIVMPYHKLFDAASEVWRGKDATGSLRLGIGYCYEDRNNRVGIRMEDLVRPKILREKIIKILPLKLAILGGAYKVPSTLTVDQIVDEYTLYGKKLKKYIGDVSSLICKKIKTKRFLFEQAHGTMLDPVFGTYPYTVAPPTIASAVFPSVGIPAQTMDVLGVMKAYTTRVGNGPFPTELFDETGEAIRAAGREFGTVSKRPRRCGWIDLPQLRYAVRLNGATSLAVTKLDVLSTLSEIKVCTHYLHKGVRLNEFVSEMGDLAGCTPVYVTLPGWKVDIGTVTKASKLPKDAKNYLKFLQKHLQVPIGYVSVGAERKALLSL